MFSLSIPLHNTFWKQDQSLSRRMLLIFFGMTLLTFASQLSIPLQPVPLTFQSTGVILIGMAYGWRDGSKQS